MAKSRKTKPARNTAKPPDDQNPAAPDEQIFASNLSLHDLFARSTAAMLENSDLSDEQKQSILIGMNCPCCGAGGMSITVKLKRGK